MTELLLAAGWILIVATLLPLWRHEAWWVRVLDFPRLQLFILLAFTLVADLTLVDSSSWTVRLSIWTVRLSIMSVAGCMLYQLWWIFPYTRMSRKEVKSTMVKSEATRIRFMISNVLASNRRSGDFLRLVSDHKPDLVVTLETNRWWQEQLDVLESDYPHTVKCPLENLYGMHLYSKLPLANSAVQFLVEPDVPSIHTEVVLRSGNRIRLHCLHPSPPVPQYTGQSAERDAELLVVGKSIASSDSPVIVTGDLNDVAWSETTRLFRRCSGLLDPRVGRMMLNTFHAGFWFMRWPLDHVFHTAHFRLNLLQRLPDIGSDHFPVLVELSYGDEDADQQGLAPDADDRQRVQEKLQDQGVSAGDVHDPSSERRMARG